MAPTLVVVLSTLTKPVQNRPAAAVDAVLAVSGAAGAATAADLVDAANLAGNY
jgi:hypothetical protein